MQFGETRKETKSKHAQYALIVVTEGAQERAVTNATVDTQINQMAIKEQVHITNCSVDDLGQVVVVNAQCQQIWVIILDSNWQTPTQLVVIKVQLFQQRQGPTWNATTQLVVVEIKIAKRLCAIHIQRETPCQLVEG